MNNSNNSSNIYTTPPQQQNPALYHYDANDNDHEWNDRTPAAAAAAADSDMVLVRTTDGKPPRGQEALWTRVWNLNDVDNVYDLGGLQNFVDVWRGR